MIETFVGYCLYSCVVGELQKRRADDVGNAEEKKRESGPALINSHIARNKKVV